MFNGRDPNDVDARAFRIYMLEICTPLLNAPTERTEAIEHHLLPQVSTID